jgi:DNA primase
MAWKTPLRTKMIPSNIIEEVRERSDIVAVVSEYVKLKKSGKNYLGLCPFHSEKTPSFTVSPDKKLFHCFGCAEGGNIFSFVMKMENASFQEAVKSLGDKIGVAVQVPGGDAGEGSRNFNLYEVTKLAAQYFHENLVNGTAGAAARNYLNGRNIDDKAISTFNLGYSLDSWDSLIKHLVGRGVAPLDMEKTGLLVAKETGGYYDRFRGRIMFPIHDHKGRPVGFGGRMITEGEPKYMNSPECPIYSKSRVLYGLNMSKDLIRKENTAIVVEGNLDLISCTMAGIRNVVASMGTALTEDQCRLLGRFCGNIILAYDSDLAGNAATERGVEMLKKAGFIVRIAEISGGKDPDELIRHGGPSSFLKVLENSMSWLRYKINSVFKRHDLNDIESRAKAIREVAALIAREPDRLVREEYIKLVAEQLRSNPESIAAEVKRESYYSKRAEGSPASRVSEKPRPKILQAEEALLRLAIEDEEARNTIKENIHWGEFTEGVCRSIAEIIFTVDVAGDMISFLLENLPDDAAKKRLSAIMVADGPSANVKGAVMDYIGTIKAHHMRAKIFSLRSALEAAESGKDLEKAKALHREFLECNTVLRSLEKSV